MSATALGLPVNFSLLSIPLFHLLALLPHAIAIGVISRGQPKNWDNRNPRSDSFRQSAQKRLSPAQFSYWERLEAAHANSFENMPLYYSAVIAGNLAGLNKGEGWGVLGGLDAHAAAFLAIRLVYLAVYAGNDTQAKSVPRSLLYFASVGVCYSMLWQSAVAAL